MPAEDVVSIADRVPGIAAERERAASAPTRGVTEPPPQAAAAPGATTLTLTIDATSAKDIEAALSCMLNPVLKRKGLEPLDAEELKRGGESLAPAANRYIPALLREHPELCLAVMFAFGVIVRRWPESAPPDEDDGQDDDDTGDAEG